MPTAHPSGWAHADGALRANRPGGPHWLREPDDPDALDVPEIQGPTRVRLRYGRAVVLVWEDGQWRVDDIVGP